jgi:DUF4097 and DUF4098 domain-containing protein YvlB
MVEAARKALKEGMRRGSLFAPLLLIGLGALFLARNIYPELQLVDYLAKYWPFLLIIWGVLRLAEVLYWHSSGKPLPRTGVSGGEWVIILFLVVFGVSLHAARGFYTWLPRERITFGGLDMFGESYDYPIAAEKPASKTPRITLESFRGNAHIVGADVATVKVVGHNTIRSLDQAGADRANQSAPYEIEGDADHMMLRAHQDRFSGPQRIMAELEITVPRGASIEAHGRTGDFDINDIDGSVTVNSDNAGVRLENIGGETRIDLRRSDIVRVVNLKNTLEIKGRGDDIDLENILGQVTINGAYTGALQLRNLAKPLHYTGTQTELEIAQLPGEARSTRGDFTADHIIGPIRLSGRSRDVQISNFSNSLDLSIDRGDISLHPGLLPLARMDVHNRSGDVELSLPSTSKFDLNASTSRGDLSNEFGSPLSQEHSGNGGSIRGSNGGPTVNIRVDRGDVTVRKSSGEEAPFVPKTGEVRLPSLPPLPEAPPAPPAPKAPKMPPLQKLEQ